MMNTFFCTRQYSNIFRELDIVLWELRYPVVLSDTMSVQLWTRLRLLLISDFVVSLHDPFISDVLRVMSIDAQEICMLTINQIGTLILPIGFSCHCWWIGITILRDFHGVCLHTPSLSALKCNIQAKRDFWNQISRVIQIFHK